MNYQIYLRLSVFFFLGWAISAFNSPDDAAEDFSQVEDTGPYELFTLAMLEEEQEPKVFNLLDRFYHRSSPPWWLRQVKIPDLISELAEKEALLADDEVLAPEAPIIAVFDSAADFTHPALRGRIWENPRPGTAGCADDSWGCDTTRGEGTLLGRGPALPFMTTRAGEKCPPAHSPHERQLRSSCLHGTHVAGVIAGNAVFGVDGLCPTCKILSIKVVELVDGQGRVTDVAFLRALQYVRNLNRQLSPRIKIVNFSFGKFQWSLAVAHKIAEMRREGVLFIAAAGNENTSEKVFPAALPGVLAVTALDSRGRKTPYANYGSWVDIAAPGGTMDSHAQGGILSAAPGGEYYLSQGTSVASPLVAGAAGLLLSLDGDMEADALQQRLLANADSRLYDHDFALGYNEGYYKYDQRGKKLPLLGRGVLDVNAAWKSLSSDDGEVEKSPRRRQVSCGTFVSAGNSSQGGGHRAVYLLFLLIPLALCVEGWWRKESSLHAK